MTYTGPERRQHGQRRMYVAGCRCVLCCRANTAYFQQWRVDKAKGRRRLGQRVPAGSTWKRLRQLCYELEGAQHVAARLGLQTPRLRFDTERVTIATYVKVARLYRGLMAEGPEAP